MGKPFFAVENFFNTIMFPAHTVSANEAATDHEAFRVGTARRMAARNHWTPTTLNQIAWLKGVMNRMRAFNFMALDRGHNLAGHEIELQASNDNFDTYWTPVSVTVPSNIHAPARLTDSPGVVTEEGAWLYRFAQQMAYEVRLYVPAMGATLKPQVVGLYVSNGWEPDFLLDLPFGWGDRHLIVEESVGDTGWVSSTRPAQRYERDFPMKLSSPAEYELARYHIETQYLRRRAMWCIFDQDQAERAWLAMPPAGRVGFETREGWSNMQATIPAVEHEPKLI